VPVPDDAMHALTVDSECQDAGRLRVDHLLGLGLEAVGQARHGPVAHRLELIFAQEARILRHDAALLVLQLLGVAGREANSTVRTVHLHSVNQQIVTKISR